MYNNIYKYKNIAFLLSNINIYSMEKDDIINNNNYYEIINLDNICNEEYKNNKLILNNNEDPYEIYSLLTYKNKGLFTINEKKKVIFYDCNSKKNIGLFTNNKDIKIISIDKLCTGVVNLNSLFKNCVNLEYVYINENKFYLNNISSMFENCKNLKRIFGLRNMNTENVKYMSYMFSECNNLEIIDLTCFQTDNLKYCNHMFFNCNKLKNIIFKTNYCYKLFDYLYFTEDNEYFSLVKKGKTYTCYEEYIDVEFTDIKTYKFDEIIINYNKLSYNYDKSIDILYNNKLIKTLNYFEFKKKNNYEMIEFYDNLICNYFAKKYIIDGFDTIYIKNMSYMFYGCNNLKELNIGNFKIINCDNLKKMFYNCNNLEVLNIFNFKDYNVKNFSEIFGNCNNLKTIINNNNSLILNKLFILKKNLNDNNFCQIIDKKSIDNFSLIIFEYLYFLKKNKNVDINLNIYNENIFENIKKIYNKNTLISGESINLNEINNINSIEEDYYLNDKIFKSDYNKNKELNTWFNNLNLYNNNIGMGSSAFIIKASDNLKNKYALKFISYKYNKNLIKNELKYKVLNDIINNNLINKSHISFTEKCFIISNLKINDKIFCFISKFCENGNLSEFIRNNKIKINLKDIIYISGELINLLKEMDDIGLYHGDFNPNNIMFDDNYNLKIIDFSASKYLKIFDKDNLVFKKNSLKINTFGTFYYLSPEQLLGEIIDIKKFNKIDIFCFGSIIYQLMFNNHPYNMKNSIKYLDVDYDDHFSAMYYSIIKNKIINYDDSEKKNLIINEFNFNESLIYDKFLELLEISLNKNINHRASADDLKNTFIFKLYNKNYRYLKNEFVNKNFKYNI